MYPLTCSPGPVTLPIEFFRLPRLGGRDPHFGLSRSWYYKAGELGEIRLVSLRRRGMIRGVRLVSYDSVIEHIRRASAQPSSEPARTA
jgi:hypothetical protein